MLNWLTFNAPLRRDVELIEAVRRESADRGGVGAAGAALSSRIASI